LAVAFAIAVFGNVSAILNPAAVLCLLISGDIRKSEALCLMAAEFMGAFFGGILVWITYFPHFQKTPDTFVLPFDKDQVRKLQKKMDERPIGSIVNRESLSHDTLSCFCNRPAIYHLPSNFVCEFLCAFVLLFGLQLIGNRVPSFNTDHEVNLFYASGLEAFLVGMYIFLLTASIGGYLLECFLI
jgi:glycerol uptake facilitator protein